MGCVLTAHASVIKGSIHLPAGWEAKIYLSHIHSFNGLNTASFHFLISETEIDSKGDFLFDSLSLPKGDHLYRLHICKKGDPVSTIFIGGKEQNHLHFIANEESNIVADIQNFYDFSINGHNGNSTLQKLFELKKELNAPLAIPSEQNRELHRHKILNEYISIANASSSPINKLFAAHLIHESFELTDHIDLFEQLNTNLASTGDSSPYFKEFQSLVEFARFNKEQSQSQASSKGTVLPWIGLALVLLLTGFWFSKKTSKAEIKAQSTNLLSVQERKVYELLKAGKSNKEISSELHIEVSTVKSHVYKIYNKLGIKSRKEIVV